MKRRFALILLAAAAVAFGVHLLRPKNVEPVEPPIVLESAPVEEQMRDAIQMPQEDGTPSAVLAKDDPQLGPKLELSRGKLEWEARIEDVTNATDLNDTAKSRRLLGMIAALPENALARATEEATHRLPDADYNSVALPVVTNPQTHGSVESVLFADLMERPDNITLPALLRIARIPNHPYARFAHDNLDLLIGENFGADWLKWEAAIQKTLAAEK